MAESSNKTTGLGPICALCNNEYQEPKLLKCLHSFCRKCLEDKLTPSTEEERVIVCPLCQTKTPLPNGEVTDLTRNHALESSYIQDQFLQNRVTKCQSCFQEGKIRAKCLHEQCKNFLCANCLKAHQNMTILHEHKIIMLEPEKNSSSSRRCVKHPGFFKSLYCEPCKQTLCRKCECPKHLRHRIVEIAETVKMY